MLLTLTPGSAVCPVPMAIVKGVEAAIGAALPKDVVVKIEKVDA